MLQIDQQSLRNFLKAEEEFLQSHYNQRLTAGWNELSDFLSGYRNEITKAVSQQAYEYWTISMILELFLEKGDYPIEDHILIQPAEGEQGKGSVILEKHTVWCEPRFPPYHKGKLLEKCKDKLEFLIDPGRKIFVMPDILLMRGRYQNLNFPYYSFTWTAMEFPDDLTSSREEVFEMISTHMRILSDIIWIMECKEQEPAKEDLTQFLFYVLAYRTPSLLILHTKLPDQSFYKDIEFLNNEGFEAGVIEDFKIGQRELCLDKLKSFLG